LLLFSAVVLLAAIGLAGCGVARSGNDALPSTTEADSTSTIVVSSSTLSDSAGTTSTPSESTTEATLVDPDSLAAANVVRTYFTTLDPKVMYGLTFQSTETSDSSADGGSLPQPADISNLVVSGPVAGVPRDDPIRNTWKERLLFGVSYHLDATSPYGESAGPKELCVVVARQDAQSPWKILYMNQGPPPKELPAEQRDKLDKLSLADMVRTYFECFDFDTQVYLSAPRHQEDLVMAMRDPTQKGDVTDPAIGTPYAGSSSIYSKEDWPIQRELTVTYELLVARDYASGMSNPESPGEQMRFVIVGEQEEGGPWKILEVGTGP
jgi:hypothetical protein